MTAPAARPEVKIGPWIQQGFDLLKAHPGPLILGALLAVALSVVTLGILAGPMAAGLAWVVLGLARGRTPRPGAGEVFKGFGWFLDALVFFVLWMVAAFLGSAILGVVPVLGALLSFAWHWVLQAFLMFALFLIVDRNLGFWPAAWQSVEMVRSNLGPFLGFGVIASLIGSAGVLAFGIGVIVTYPLQVCIVAAAYRELWGEERAETAPSAQAPPPPPPPPPA
jgi:uncharacterized membrane protein